MLAYAQNPETGVKPREAKWGQDKCARCAMALKDPLNSAQIVNPETGETFMFDDLGCAVAWLDDKNPAWRSKAVIYVNDATDGAWLKMDEAILANPYPTPMSYGIAAFRNKEKVGADKTVLTVKEAEKLILDTALERKKKKAMKHQ
ncbi:MAG: hypothetical protein LBE75_01140 [Burkholderiales bacterium]|nr:hypothetical protein [Burkholderiales bacterium]